MRIQSPTCAFSDRPFAGEGVSLYATLGSVVQYRNHRIFGGRKRRRGFGFVKGSQAAQGYGNGVTKSARVDSVAFPTDSIAFTFPTSFNSQTVAWDVRHYLDDLENLSSNFLTQVTAIGSTGGGTSTINATASVVGQQQRAGGVVRFTVQINPSTSGVQPILIRLHRTAGPSSPADALANYASGVAVLEIDSPALLDSAPYTYQLNLENGSVVLVAETGIAVQADATGPPAPTFVTLFPV